MRNLRSVSVFLGLVLVLTLGIGGGNEETGKMTSHQYCPLHSGTSLWASVLTPIPGRASSQALMDRDFCFAPETDPEYVARFSERIFGSFSSSLDYIIQNRWSSTASGGTGSMGDPITLTYSFVPDGTTVWDEDPPDGWGDRPSTLFATMNGQFATEAQWKGLFATAFNYWGDKTGLTFIETVDDGATLYDPVTFSGHSPGVLGVRGDIRIAAAPMDGSSGVLAYNWYPNIGDMVMDNAENWNSSSYNYGLFVNTVAHEFGHAIGISHVCPNGCTILMDPYICTSIGGPQHDDLRAGQRNYGDNYENNNTAATATNLGFLGNETESVLNVSTDDNSDIDWYKFEVGASKQAEILLQMVGSSYLNCAQTPLCSCSVFINSLDDANLDVRLYGSDGTTVLATGASQPAGVNETIPETVLPGAGIYYLRVNPDASDAIQMYNLAVTISPGTSSVITVTRPNGSETFFNQQVEAINWTSVNVTGNVMIELNRNYPSGTWEVLFASTPNDGTQNWTVTGPYTINARVRVTSLVEPLATDVSNGAFTILVPAITITRPNGGESLNGEVAEVIQWSTTSVTGNILIELNRDYPTGTWENIATVPNSGTNQVLGGPSTANARMRLTSVSYPSATDISDAAFSVYIIDNPPTITHDRHGDCAPGTVTFVATVTDDHSSPTTRLYYRITDTVLFDSTAMNSTGNPNEVAADLILANGRYDYYLRTVDAILQSAATDTFYFDVGGCPDIIALDDGSAEGFNWAQETEYEWAIKVEPTGYPYFLCGLQVAVARIAPDAVHSPIMAKVYNSDGFMESPNTELWSEISGSIGNTVGGLPSGTLHWATVLVDSGSGTPLMLNQPFYLSVSNPVFNKYEAFGRDMDTPTAGSSFFFEGCDMEWLSESDEHDNAQGGTRMIRAIGYSLAAPTDLVIYSSGDDIVLNWSDSGAPYYRIFSALTPDGPFTTVEGSTETISFVDDDAALGNELKFYQVVGSVTP